MAPALAPSNPPPAKSEEEKKGAWRTPAQQMEVAIGEWLLAKPLATRAFGSTLGPMFLALQAATDNAAAPAATTPEATPPAEAAAANLQLS